MKKIFVLFFYFCFFLNSFALGNLKFAVLDFEKIFKNSFQYKKIIDSMNYNFYKKYLILNNEINDLIKEKKQKNDNYYLNDMIKNSFNIKKKYVFLKINKLEKEINSKNINIHNLFIYKIKKIINSLIKKNKYDIIFDSNSIFYYNKNIFDITNYIINKLN